jgi:signal transduction histidine kinase
VWRRLRALAGAAILLARGRTLDEVLQTLVDTAREVLQARYAALGVLDRTGTGLGRFLTSGLTPEQVARIGSPPRGRGILGVVIREARPIRVRDLGRDPRAHGFPPNHPPMRSFLGVPIRVGDRVFGNLYVTDKLGADEFTAEDEELAEWLAAQAAVALENARLYEEQRVFTAIVNHEIRNAVAGVLGWTERLGRLAEGGGEPGALAEAARYAREAAANLHKLVADLLELSRIESGRVELAQAETDVGAAIRDAVAFCRPSADNRQVSIRVEEGEAIPTLVTDGRRVRQILLNLLSNAIKFTEEGTAVTVRLRVADGGGVAIDVLDRGPGVPPEEREAIFAAYRQVNRAHGEVGTGLGLTVSRALARLLGGDITVTDAPGGGACFTLVLPANARQEVGATEGARG